MTFLLVDFQIPENFQTLENDTTWYGYIKTTKWSYRWMDKKITIQSRHNTK